MRYSKKFGLQRNAVLPVLLYGTAAGALIFIPFIILSRIFPEFTSQYGFFIPPASIEAHLMFLLKSIIVSTAWLFGYFSVKHLPVTLLAPLNSSGPVWTMLGAIIIYGEKMNALQWIGVAISLGFYYVLSFGGNKTGVEKEDKRWIFFAFLSIIFNSISALFDKYLVREYDRIAMQSWFSIYTTLIFLIIVVIIWYPTRKKNNTIRLEMVDTNDRIIPSGGRFLLLQSPILRGFAGFHSNSYSQSISCISICGRSNLL